MLKGCGWRLCARRGLEQLGGGQGRRDANARYAQAKVPKRGGIEPPRCRRAPRARTRSSWSPSRPQEIRV